jgi:hypothetical protein
MTAAIAMRQAPRIADQIRPETRPWMMTSIMVDSPEENPDTRRSDEGGTGSNGIVWG